MRRLDSQLSCVDVIDSKIMTVLGVAGASIGIFAGFLAVVVDTSEAASVIFAFSSGTVILGIYVAAMAFGLRGSAIGKWDQRPQLGGTSGELCNSRCRYNARLGRGDVRHIA